MERFKLSLVWFGLAILTVSAATPAFPARAGVTSVRFATFNASLNRNSAGALVADLSTPGNAQAQTNAKSPAQGNRSPAAMLGF